jgi:hypothetical protein
MAFQAEGSWCWKMILSVPKVGVHVQINGKGNLITLFSISRAAMIVHRYTGKVEQVRALLEEILQAANNETRLMFGSLEAGDNNFDVRVAAYRVLCDGFNTVH